MATIQGIYLALFGRPADPAGLAYFNGVTKNGADLSGIGNLAGQKEYTDRFTGKSTNEIINSIYQSLFGRDGETAGVAFWANKLATGALTINNIAIAILDGALGSDKTIVTAKIAAADLFTTHLDLPAEQQAYGANTVSLARDYITTIGASHAGTGTEVDALIARMLTNAGQAPGDGGDTSTGGGGAPANVPATFVDDAHHSLSAIDSKTNGSVVVTDTDGASTFLTNGKFSGEYGTFSFGSEGNTGGWVYNLSPEGTEALKALQDGEKATDSFTVTAADGTTHTISVDINGVSDAPVFGGTDTATISEDETEKQSGTITATDADHDQSGFQAVDAKALATEHGVFTFNEATGDWTFVQDTAASQSLAAEETVTDTLTVKSIDGTEHTITVTINGANDAPVFGGTNTATISEDETEKQSGNITVTDADHDQSGFQAVDAASLTTTHGAFTFNEKTGDWTFLQNTAASQSLQSGESATDTLTVKSIDGTDHTISVTITGANDAPVFGGAATATITEDETAQSGTITVTDADHDQSGFQAVAAGTLTTAHGAFTFDEKMGDWTFLQNTAASQSLQSGESATDTLTVKSIDGTEHTITVTINGANDAPVFGGTATATISEDETEKQSGNITVTDADHDQSGFQAVDAASLTTTHGAFTFDEKTGDWTFLQNTAASQSLQSGESATDTLTVKSIDGTDHTISVTITGANDAPVFGGAATATITEDETALQSGTITVTDADHDQSGFQAIAAGTLTTAHGAFTFNEATGDWTFLQNTAASQSLRSGESATDTLTVKSTDGTDHSISVTINGVNDAPVFGGSDTVSINEDTAAKQSGKLTVVDADHDQSGFQAVAAGSLTTAHGAFTFNEATGDWAFVQNTAASQSLQAGESVTDTLKVKSIDGTEHSISVNISGVNDAPTFSGSDSATITEDTAAKQSGTLKITDADHDQSSFKAVSAGALTTAHGAFTFNETTGDWSFVQNTAASQSLKTGQSVTDTLTVTSIDNTVHTINVTINGENDAPVPGTATAASVTQGAQFTFTIPTATDAESDPLTYGKPTAAHGTIVANGNSYVYTADANYTGADSIQYTVSDKIAAPVTGSIGVTVLANAAPTFVNTNVLSPLSVAENTVTATTIANIVGNDAEDGAGKATLSLTGGSDYFTLSDKGVLSLKANQDFEAFNSADPTVTATITAKDSLGKTSTETFTVHISDVKETVSATSGSPNVDKSASFGAWTINGNDSNNTLAGGKAADTITGGEGADTLTGNGGADVFKYNSVSDSYSSTFNSLTRDTITDFTPGTDKIDISAIDANLGKSGDQAFNWGGESSNPANGNVSYFYGSDGNTYVVADVDNSNGTDLVIKLSGHITLSASDFIL